VRTRPMIIGRCESPRNWKSTSAAMRIRVTHNYNTNPKYGRSSLPWGARLSSPPPRWRHAPAVRLSRGPPSTERNSEGQERWEGEIATGLDEDGASAGAEDKSATSTCRDETADVAGFGLTDVLARLLIARWSRIDRQLLNSPPTT